MTKLSISDLSKKPSLLDEIDDIIEIVNKKTNEVKGVFIGRRELPYIREMLEELEYRKWLERNKKGLKASSEKLEDLFENPIKELGERIEHED